MSTEWKGRDCVITWDDPGEKPLFYNVEIKHGDADNAEPHVRRSESNVFRYTFDDNVADGGPAGPSRILKFRVQKAFADGRYSEFTPTALRVVNPQMPAPTNVRAVGSSGVGRLIIGFDDPPPHSDYKHTIVWIDDTPAPTDFPVTTEDMTDIVDENPRKGKNQPVELVYSEGVYARVQVAHADDFGEDGLNRSPVKYMYAHSEADGKNTIATAAGPSYRTFSENESDTQTYVLIRESTSLNSFYRTGLSYPTFSPSGRSATFQHQLTATIDHDMRTPPLDIKSYNNSNIRDRRRYRYREIKPDKIKLIFGGYGIGKLLEIRTHTWRSGTPSLTLGTGDGDTGFANIPIQILNGDTHISPTLTNIIIPEQPEIPVSSAGHADMMKEGTIPNDDWNITWQLNSSYNSTYKIIYIYSLTISITPKPNLTLNFDGDTLLSARCSWADNRPVFKAKKGLLNLSSAGATVQLYNHRERNTITFMDVTDKSDRQQGNL